MLSEAPLGDGSTATTLRTRGGEMTVTDGPFAEAAEQIGGFYLLDAPDLDTVIELCRLLPRSTNRFRNRATQPGASVRAELARRVGDLELAHASYRTAIDQCSNDIERAHLLARFNEIHPSGT